MELGKFTKDPKTGIYTGAVRTLSSAVENVTIVPAEKTNESSPDFRVLGPFGSDFGAAWLQERKEGEYLSLVLRDPEFNHGKEMRPALFPQRDGGWSLIWNPHQEATPAPTRPAFANGSAADEAAALS